MTDKRTVMASNHALVAFDTRQSEYARRVYGAELISGHWPDCGELLKLADGGGDFAAYFGGEVEPLMNANFKRVSIFID